MSSFSFQLEPAAPFRLDLTVWVLRRRPENQIDRWDGRTYSRVLVVKGHALEVSVSSMGSVDAPRLKITAKGMRIRATLEAELRSILSRMLGVNEDISGFYRLAHKEKRLTPLVERFRGVKPPRFSGMFEALVNAVACQQLSLAVGILLLNRLSNACGRAASSQAHAFPDPSDVLRMREEELKSMGFSGAKARAILGLARAVHAGSVNLEKLAEESDAAARESLLLLKGIGGWSADYAMLRGMGRLSIFPAHDAGARRKLQLLYGRKGLSYKEMARLADHWSPWGGLVYFHLLLSGLYERGLISSSGLEE